MLALGVLEKIVDALLLQEPADELKVRLAVLHAVLPLRIGAGQAGLKIGEAAVAENLRDNFWDRLFLEDAAVRGTGEQPEPGSQGDLVLDQGAVLGRAELSEAASDAVEVAHAAIRQRQGDIQRFAEELVRRNRPVGAEQIQLVRE